MIKRPSGSNADEWNLFLLDHLGPMNNGSAYVAVQIAEAIDASRASHDRLLAAAKEAFNAWNRPGTMGTVYMELEREIDSLRASNNRLVAAAMKVIEQADRETNAFRELRVAIAAAAEKTP